MTGDEGTYVEAAASDHGAQRLSRKRPTTPSPIARSPMTTAPLAASSAPTATTPRVIGERQLVLLRELAAATADARTGSDVCERARARSPTNPRDLPFALLYIAESGGSESQLAGATGIKPGHPAAPASMHAERSLRLAVCRCAPAPEPAARADLSAALGADTAERRVESRAAAQAVVLPVMPAGETGGRASGGRAQSVSSVRRQLSRLP